MADTTAKKKTLSQQEKYRLKLAREEAADLEKIRIKAEKQKQKDLKKQPSAVNAVPKTKKPSKSVKDYINDFVNVDSITNAFRKAPPQYVASPTEAAAPIITQPIAATSEPEIKFTAIKNPDPVVETVVKPVVAAMPNAAPISSQAVITAALKTAVPQMKNGAFPGATGQAAAKARQEASLGDDHSVRFATTNQFYSAVYGHVNGRDDLTKGLGMLAEFKDIIEDAILDPVKGKWAVSGALARQEAGEHNAHEVATATQNALAVAIHDAEFYHDFDIAKIVALAKARKEEIDAEIAMEQAAFAAEQQKVKQELLVNTHDVSLHQLTVSLNYLQNLNQEQFQAEFDEAMQINPTYAMYVKNSGAIADDLEAVLTSDVAIVEPNPLPMAHTLQMNINDDSFNLGNLVIQGIADELVLTASHPVWNQQTMNNVVLYVEAITSSEDNLDLILQSLNDNDAVRENPLGFAQFIDNMDVIGPAFKGQSDYQPLDDLMTSFAEEGQYDWAAIASVAAHIPANHYDPEVVTVRQQQANKESAALAETPQTAVTASSNVLKTAKPVSFTPATDKNAITKDNNFAVSFREELVLNINDALQGRKENRPEVATPQFQAFEDANKTLLAAVEKFENGDTFLDPNATDIELAVAEAYNNDGIPNYDQLKQMIMNQQNSKVSTSQSLKEAFMDNAVVEKPKPIETHSVVGFGGFYNKDKKQSAQLV